MFMRTLGSEIAAAVTAAVVTFLLGKAFAWLCAQLKAKRDES